MAQSINYVSCQRHSEAGSGTPDKISDSANAVMATAATLLIQLVQTCAVLFMFLTLVHAVGLVLREQHWVMQIFSTMFMIVHAQIAARKKNGACKQ